MILSDEKLFLRVYDELKQKSSSQDPYDLLRIALLLRQLIVDGSNSLVSKTNRKYRLKLSFTIADYSMTKKEEGLAELTPEILQQIIEEAFPGEKVINLDLVGSAATGRVRILPKEGEPQVRLNIDQLLGRKIVMKDFVEFSIVDTIKLTAHVYGGVHLGEPDSVQKELIKTFENLSTEQNPYILTAIREIAVIILDGLQPLKDAIEGQTR